MRLLYRQNRLGQTASRWIHIPWNGWNEQDFRASAYTRRIITYTYDPLYRLVEADYSTGELFEYVYDSVGNRTRYTETITSTNVITYAYDAANRLTNVDGVAYTWDDNGNLLNDGSKTYTYTQANRLIAVSDQQSAASFVYNGDGARVKQVVDGHGITYTLDLATPLVTVLAERTDTTTTHYIYALGTRPLAQHGDEWEYLLPDVLGSVRQLVDADGNVTLAQAYQPYGSLLESQGSGHSTFGYAGEQADESGLIYLRARYYFSGLGVFLSKDPWSGDVLRPGSMNGWSYVECNPTNLTDPFGLRPGGTDEIGDIRDELDALMSTGQLETRYQYSCNCGWIDWGHALARMQSKTSLAHTIFNRLKANVDWSAYGRWTGKRGIEVETNIGVTGIGLVRQIAVVPEPNLSNHSLLPRIAAGIFIEHSEQVEEHHLMTIFSYFSEEDLPSNLIGLYLATRMQEGPEGGNLELYRQALDEIIQLCGVVDEQESRTHRCMDLSIGRAYF